VRHATVDGKLRVKLILQKQVLRPEVPESEQGPSDMILLKKFCIGIVIGIRVVQNVAFLDQPLNQDSVL